MQVIHISGTQCSGKTFISKPYHNHPDVAFWDVLELYEREGCLIDDRMDWDRWEVVRDIIVPDLEGFLKTNADKNVCIIESGTNQTINSFLRTLDNVINIQLEIPPVKVIQARAEERKLNVKRVLEFREMFLRKHVHHDIPQYSQEEASLILKAYVEGEIKVSIIGTAGRKEDGNKMSRGLYVEMYKKAIDILANFELIPRVVHLVSGGAAWADHIAVSLYLGHFSNQLTLHLPALFCIVENKYVPLEVADTANYYHKLFAQKMGRSTLEGITKAIEKGAKTTISDDFKARNLKVADCDLMIAFTWGEGDEPKQGGTHHTWTHSAAPVKIHVPLKELQKES